MEEYDDFWGRKEKVNWPYETETIPKRKIDKAVLCKDSRSQTYTSPWCYLLGFLFLFGFLAWLLYALRRNNAPATGGKKSLFTVPSRVQKPVSVPPPTKTPIQMSPQEVLARILDVLRSRLQNTKGLSDEQKYILSPEQISKWKLTSTQPLMFVFPAENGSSPVKRNWELFYDYNTQNVSLSPVGSSGQKPQQPPQPPSRPSETDLIPTPAGGPNPGPSPSPLNSYTWINPPVTKTNPPPNASEYGFFSPTSKSTPSLFPWNLDQSSSSSPSTCYTNNPLSESQFRLFHS
jgi:hypothetical protein